MIVNNMRQDFSVFEFNKLMNEAKPIFSTSNRKFFVNAKTLEKLNLLLVQEKIFMCRTNDFDNNQISMSLNDIYSIIESRLKRKIDKIIKRRTEESLCEITNYYIFTLK